MDELLVKYKDVDDFNDYSFISAHTYKGKVADIIPLLKQVDTIKLRDDFYSYVSCEFEPSSRVGELDVLYIYVESYDEGG